ncbi:ubiquinone biosynthesis monooxygenase COQ6, mitochondrial-like [Homarus americanus]|uniref:ubiquinone biosynthesis monooxygenase COQ6, mitochondrial-like n=1 Tax=Homarus americanus TaxID=6706 RepID=UPI001C466B1D|nr:ubiquinone biosynthesis monooxygenase COQ6, mitochondrial-like [Homarus americanus]
MRDKLDQVDHSELPDSSERPATPDAEGGLTSRGPKQVLDSAGEFNNRVCDLSGHTQNLFRKLGAWGHIEGIRAQPVRRMQLWESCSEAMMTFDEQDQEDVVAHIVENDVILHAIKQQVPDQVEVEYNTKVEGYELPLDPSSRVTISLHDGRKLSADLLIGVDGAKSLVRPDHGHSKPGLGVRPDGHCGDAVVIRGSRQHCSLAKALSHGPCRSSAAIGWPQFPRLVDHEGTRPKIFTAFGRGVYRCPQ